MPFRTTRSAAGESSKGAGPSCRKGAMLADSMLLSSFPFMDQPSNFLLGGKSGAEYDHRVWRHDKREWALNDEDSPDSRPPARWKGSFCKVNEDQLVLFGGSADAETYLNDAWMYHASSESWELLPAKPADKKAGVIPPRRAHSGLVVGGGSAGARLVVFGGSGGDNEDPLRDLWTLDLATHVWELHSSVPFPLKARKGHTAVLVGKQMLVFGGRHNDVEYFDDLVSLHFDDEWRPTRWEVVEPPHHRPAKRNHHVAVPLSGDQMLVYGGRDTHDLHGELMNDVWLYHVPSARWTQVDTLHPDDSHEAGGGHPTPRIEAAYATTMHDNQLLMGFGQAQSERLLNDLWTLELLQDARTGKHHGTWRVLHVDNCSEAAVVDQEPHHHHQAKAAKGGVEASTTYSLSVGLVLLVLLALWALYRWRPRGGRQAAYEPI